MCTSTRTLSFLIFPSLCLLVLTKLLPNPFINHSILSDIPSSLPSTFLYILSSFYVSSVFHPMFPNSLLSSVAPFSRVFFHPSFLPAFIFVFFFQSFYFFRTVIRPCSYLSSIVSGILYSSLFFFFYLSCQFPNNFSSLLPTLYSSFLP